MKPNKTALTENALKIRIRFLIFLIVASKALSNCGIRSSESGVKKFLNRLSLSHSAYLRAHADNPVDWYEWGPEALQKAKQENKPLIISIGYSSCHWCHVMEEESFMDTTVARLMNAYFIPIKIDREERPDIDQIYVNAAELLSGHAGWPLNAFALPDGKPFYAATYFPRDQWVAILNQIKDAFENEKDAVIKQAQALTEGIKAYDQMEVAGTSETKIDRQAYLDIFNRWSAGLDYEYGGLQDVQKFPMPSLWEFGLQYHFMTGNNQALEIVTTTLDHMAYGAIYDQLGGGFSRYCTDRKWRLPHFEKMLYDNAQLVSLYAHAWQVTGNSRYAEVIRETLKFIETEMTAEQGGFYASLNADSEGVEGKFYAWTKGEIERILGRESAELFCDYYNVLDSGNWENGKNILYANGPVNAHASRQGRTSKEMDEIIKAAKKKLLHARSARISPSADEKILTSWNALMVTGYLDAYVAIGDESYLQTALDNARFLQKNMIREDGALWRSYSENQYGIEGFLDDYAYLARAFISLYQLTFEIHWLERAKELADFVIAHFYDKKSGMFYYTSDLSDPLVVRKMELADHVMPSANSVLAEVLLLLGTYFQQNEYTAIADKMLDRILDERVTALPHFYANWARVTGFSVYEPFEIVVMGSGAVDTTFSIQQHYNPLAIYMGGEEETLPLLENKYVGGEIIIYVCRNRICKLPVRNVAGALLQMKIPD